MLPPSDGPHAGGEDGLVHPARRGPDAIPSARNDVARCSAGLVRVPEAMDQEPSPASGGRAAAAARPAGRPCEAGREEEETQEVREGP